MNISIKRRQTLLANWLYKIGCTPIGKAETESLYVEFNTKYTCKSVIRISDHLSADRTHINVILSPLNTTVVVNFKNFLWTGSFTDAKQIIYTLIMSKQVVSQQPVIPIKKKDKISVDGKLTAIESITTYQQLCKVGCFTCLPTKLAAEIKHFAQKNRGKITEIVKYLKQYGTCKNDVKVNEWNKLFNQAVKLD